MTELIKINNRKDIEILSMIGQSKPFPDHYHKHFCISLITEGIECIEINKKRIYSEKNHTSITNPDEIHANPLLVHHQKLSFHTIYVPQNVIDEIAGREHVFFEKRSFLDMQLNSHFLNLINYTKENQNKLDPSLLEKFLKRLIRHSTKTCHETNFRFNKDWGKAIKFIDTNLKNTINLDTIAQHCEMDKFKFAKTFKYFCGMSPMNYVLMNRVFEAKESISKTTNLTDLAYMYNFTDMAHFSNQFKRFIGLSPRNYQKTLQD
ncbi:MAG: AraC family transcriptional regulator [Phaeodactylibacter sp.]|uniref:AraC family transcriptional regulator n=1 Tax=Phaeodactylibacter sp. TaxID=1940289 RepID=UPI0032F07BBB